MNTQDDAIKEKRRPIRSATGAAPSAPKNVPAPPRHSVYILESEDGELSYLQKELTQSLMFGWH